MEIHEIRVRRMTPGDAAGVVTCFERGYAGTYPVDAFHDPEALAGLVRSGLLRSMVAVTPDGEVVGHMGLRLRSPDSVTADAGNTIVDPRARGRSLSAELGIALMQLAVETGLVGTHGYPTTAHPVIQKLEVEGGAFETGILYSYIPADTRYVGIEGKEPVRIAVVVVYRPLAPAPSRTARIPRRHRDLVSALYARMGLARTVVDDDTEPAVAESNVAALTESRRGMVRIEVETVGLDLPVRVAGILEDAGARPALVDLPLARPGAGWACEALAGLGFYYGALLPELAGDGDVLRLQRPGRGVSLPAPATPGAASLLDYIEADRPSGPGRQA